MDDLRIRLAFSINPQLQQLKHYISEHLHERISLADAATQFKLSRTHFSRRFHALVGVRFREWLCSQRIARARELLIQTGNSIPAVARASGFNSLSAFERSFKRVEGMSPRAYPRFVALQCAHKPPATVTVPSRQPSTPLKPAEEHQPFPYPQYRYGG